MTSPVFERLAAFLEEHGVDFTALRHAPVATSEEAARVRGTRLASGAKALLCKGEEGFVLFVMPADRRLSSRAVRRRWRWKNWRFATRAELAEVTGLVPGAVPPFGSLFGVPTCCDEALLEQEEINFNAGARDVSVRMACADWVAVERPEIGPFAELRPDAGADGDPRDA